MNKKKKEFPISDPDFLLKALNWANQFKHFAYFNDNHIPYPFEAFPHLLAVGAKDHLETCSGSLAKLRQFFDRQQDWLFGYFAYDLKNEIEMLSSNNPITIPTENVNFFAPRHMIWFKSNEIVLMTEDDPDEVFHSIAQAKPTPARPLSGDIAIKSHTAEHVYLQNVEKIKQRIVEGEYYEINYCMEFSVDGIEIDALETYLKLRDLSPMPFSALLKFSDTYVISASPERFLKKTGNKLISQPIKGTIRRGKDPVEDELLKSQLKHSEKERAENMMIVDLVRNDLAKSARPGTVKAEELFGIYSFQRLHQMISTVSAISSDSFSSFEIIENAFPMGSMTGAPKIRVMQEIEDIEDTRRGIYSGALGYFTPNGDFDLSVIIRTLVYDNKNRNLSFHVGSAITYDADPHQEYDECMLKAQTIFDWIRHFSSK